jgi:adenine-specific DNA-methyltransferase
MAKVEDLINSIPDAQLRDEIAREVANLKSQKTFGLVFEEHLPEQVLLPGLPIKPGLRVVKRGAENEIFSVIEHEGGSLKTSRFRVARESDGQEEVAAANELVVLKKFGEPIYPTLVPVDRVTRTPGKPYHTIINAENFHALQLLLYCYEGKVDVIYIDPPYNTGARDWKYNNSYVDSNDQYRHSKWLAMMKRRLRLAKRLLKPDVGVLIVTIDEHEVHHLGMLLEKEFDGTFRQMVTIVINQKGVAQGRLSRAEEYAFFCFMPNSEVTGSPDDLLTPERPDTKRFTTPRWEWLLRGGTNSRRQDRPGLFFPIFVDVEKRAIVKVGDPLPLKQSPNSVTGLLSSGADTGMAGTQSIAWPLRRDGSLGNWRVSPPTLRQLITKGYVKLGGYDKKRGTWTVLYLGRLAQRQIESGVIKIVGRDSDTGVVEIEYAEAQERQIKTVWHRSSHDAGNYGSTMLRNILGEGARFSFPKSLYNVTDSLATVTRQTPNALILDFFAGSGTTLHAVSLLNEEDNGTRRCILVTNNEVNEKSARALNAEGYWPGDPEFERNGIADSVTWPRVRYVVNGKRDDGTELAGTYLNGREMSEGFEENIEYLRLGFLDPNDVAYGDKFEAIAPILWLMAGAQGEPVSERGLRGLDRWFIPKQSPFAVLMQEDYFAEFKRELKQRPDITHVFLVTDSEEAYHEMIAGLPGSPKTKMLYKSYLDNFRINTERNL